MEAGTRFAAREFYVDPVRVEEFVLALGVTPEDDYRAGVGSVVPPGFLMYVTTYGAEVIHGELGFDMFRTVYGGSELEQRVPVRVGDRLTVQPWVSQLREKDGKAGRLTLAEITTEYVRDGAVVMVERSNVVQKG